MPVINGARGIFYWWYPTLQWHNGEKELLRSYLYGGTKVLAEAAGALSAPQPLPEWAERIPVPGGLRVLKASDGANVWIFVGNSDAANTGELILPANISIEHKLGVTPGQGKIRLAPGEISVLKHSLR
jgi:hypothetical protein